MSEVKDTVRRQSLLYHLCSLVLQTRPDSSDLYSEIPALTRCAKVGTRQIPLRLAEGCEAPLLGGGGGADPSVWAAVAGLAETVDL